MFKLLASRRFKPVDLAVAMLFAGWVPSILMAVVSYGVLSRTLDSKIIVDRSTLVEILANLIGQDLTRTGETMEHYQKLPETQTMLQRRLGDPPAQDWIARIYYAQPRIDGLFLTNAEGYLLASLPVEPPGRTEPYAQADWLEGANRTRGAYLTAVSPRRSDQRLVATLIVAVRASSGEVIGYMGAHILVQRLAERLKNLQFGEQSIAEVLDQNGMRLFDANFEPRLQPEDSPLRALRQKSPAGYFQFNEQFHTFKPIPGTGWIATLEQPIAVAYKPVRELLSKTVVLAGWLLAGTALAAWLMSRLYQRQLAADERFSRETFISQKILANMPVGIALIDPETRRILQANESFIELAQKFGKLAPDREITETSFSDLQFGLEEMFLRVREFGTPFLAEEQVIKDAQDHEHFLTINLLRLQDSNQTTQGILFLIEDETAEVTLRHELIAANTAKDRFLATLSHELRNPLSPVITMVAELDRTLKAPEPRHALEIIRRNVELEARLIDDLLDITRISHGKLQLSAQTVSAHEIVQRALEICDKDIADKQLQVDVRLEAARHHVRADPARLQQVSWNLIKNAVKFTPAGGRIEITTKNRGTEFLLEVRDSGIGIDPRRLSRIFKAFEQGEASILRRFGGLGLGLAISQAMMRAHHGKLVAHSEGEGKGATFTATLPTVDAPVGIPAAAPVAEPSAAPHRARILLVDDHEDTCAGMKLLLERRKFEVSVAHSVAAGLALGRAHRFDLLISDLGLPDGTGFELMSQLRETGLRGVALSGFGMESDLEKSRDAGFLEHLIKPVNIEQLDQILARIFPGSNGRS